MKTKFQQIFYIKLKYILLLLLFSLYPNISGADNAVQKILDFRLKDISGLYLNNFSEIQPNNKSYELKFRANDNSIEKNFSNIYNNNNNIAFLLFDGQDLIIEKYNYNMKEDKPLYWYSVTKSFVGMMVINSICQSTNISIDDNAGSYSQRLKGTVYNDVTIRNLLKMQTGTTPDNEKFNSKLLRESLTVRTNPLKWIKEIDSRQEDQGKSFWYTAHDTNALVIMLEDIQKKDMANIFSDLFIKGLSLENAVYWQTSLDGTGYGASALMATPRDMVSLTSRYMQLIKNDECINKYYNSMLERDKSGGRYGFQIWIPEKFNNAKKPFNRLYMAGNGGQNIIFDRDEGIIGVVYSIYPEYDKKKNYPWALFLTDLDKSIKKIKQNRRKNINETRDISGDTNNNILENKENKLRHDNHITTKSEFIRLIDQNYLVSKTCNIQLYDNGSGNGYCGKEQLEILWKWNEDLFCRTGFVGSKALKHSCLKVQAKLDTLIMYNLEDNSSTEYKLR